MFKYMAYGVLVALLICVVFDIVTRHFWLLLTDLLMAVAVVLILWGVRQLARLNKIK